MNLRMHFEADSRITATADHGLVAVRIEEAAGVFTQISMRADHVQAFYSALSDALTPHIHEATAKQIERLCSEEREGKLAKAAPRDEPLRDPRVDPQPGDTILQRHVHKRIDRFVYYTDRDNWNHVVTLEDWQQQVS